MTVVYYAPGPPGFMYDWHRHHLVAEFRHRGIDVVFVNPCEDGGADWSASRLTERLNDVLRSVLGRTKVDLFLGVATDDTLEPAALDPLRAHGVPSVNLSTDDLVNPYRIRGIAKHFDLIWCAAPAAVDVIRGYGANVAYLPFAANPFVFRPAQVADEPVVGFLGRCYGARSVHVDALLAGGIDVLRFDRQRTEGASGTPLGRAFASGGSLVHVAESLRFASGRACIRGALTRTVLDRLGRRPPRATGGGRLIWREPPAFEDVGRAYSAMAVSLGSIEVGSTYVLRRPLLFPRLREFEAPMSGAVHLVNRTDELTSCFAEDREMLYYGDSNELVDKAKFYVRPAQHAARQAIRVAARRRAEADHSWYARYTSIVKLLGAA